MQVVVDGSCWMSVERGVATSTRRLIAALAQRNPGLIASVLSDTSNPPIAGVPHRPCRSGQGVRRIMWQQLVLPRKLREIGGDVLYCPSYTIPLLSPLPCVVTVHDLIALDHKDLVPRRNIAHFSLLLGRSARAARRITVPTAVIRQRVIERLGVPRERIAVVPWGIDSELPRPSREEAQATVRSRFGIDGRFVLVVGCVEPKKDQHAAAIAAAQVRLPCVLAGPPVPKTPELLARIRSVEGSDLRYLGFVSTEDLGSLYAAASVLCFPSLAEGFGLPVLEAMAAGTPVVCSDLPTLREISGGSVVLVSPGNPQSLADGLSRVLNSAQLWSELSERGRLQAGRFTWARSAERFEQVLLDAC